MIKNIIKIKYLRNLFYNKPDEDILPVDNSTQNIRFSLKIGNLVIGNLMVENKLWIFRYSEDFKQQNKYGRLIGFSDLNKVYKSETLWPFFKIRIPGLKQPLVQEIIKSEKIDQNDEAMLLKRFGRKNTSNPYILEPV